MPLDGNGHIAQKVAVLPVKPSVQCEELRNFRCELRQDPRFDEWCRLTSPLGLGGQTLRALAALHDSAVEGWFPEVAAWGVPAEAKALPVALDRRDGDETRPADAVLADPVVNLPAPWRPDGWSPERSPAALPADLGASGFDGRAAVVAR